MKNEIMMELHQYILHALELIVASLLELLTATGFESGFHEEFHSITSSLINSEQPSGAKSWSTMVDKTRTQAQKKQISEKQSLRYSRASSSFLQSLAKLKLQKLEEERILNAMKLEQEVSIWNRYIGCWRSWLVRRDLM